MRESVAYKIQVQHGVLILRHLDSLVDGIAEPVVRVRALAGQQSNGLVHTGCFISACEQAVELFFARYFRPDGKVHNISFGDYLNGLFQLVQALGVLLILFDNGVEFDRHRSTHSGG